VTTTNVTQTNTRSSDWSIRYISPDLACQMQCSCSSQWLLTARKH